MTPIGIGRVGAEAGLFLVHMRLKNGAKFKLRVNQLRFVGRGFRWGHREGSAVFPDQGDSTQLHPRLSKDVCHPPLDQRGNQVGYL